MIFSSILFLYYFLPAVLILYYISPKALKNTVLLVSSLVFYAWGEPFYILLMIFSIVFNYFMALILDKSKQKLKKFILFLTIASDLAILGFYKYSGLFLQTVNSIFKTSIPVLGIALPIGISFYTFQIISYVVDVYRQDVKAQKNIVSLGTYIALFPQLIAGPIVRYSTIDEQLKERKVTADLILKGIGIFACGLAKKVILANNIGLIWDTVIKTPLSEMSVLSSWLGIIAFTLQIYFDFSGYSDMAIGLGRVFGFEFEINFNYPYVSKSITEFWRRWHISLSTWFKEYVYIPLGGSRCKKLKMCFNLLVVWFLTGLWHGASYNFILWGMYYGILLIAEKMFFRKILRKLPDFVSHIYTLFCVIIGWVLFASDNLKGVITYLGVMFGNAKFISSGFLYILRSNFVYVIVGILCSLPVWKNLYYKIPERKRIILNVILSLVCLYVSTAYLLDSTYNPFLYFRF